MVSLFFCPSYVSIATVVFIVKSLRALYSAAYALPHGIFLACRNHNCHLYEISRQQHFFYYNTFSMKNKHCLKFYPKFFLGPEPCPHRIVLPLSLFPFFQPKALQNPLFHCTCHLILVIVRGQQFRLFIVAQKAAFHNYRRRFCLF